MSYRTMTELFADPGRWCQNTMARDAHGDPTYPLDESACQWCLEGGLRKVYGYGRPAWDLYQRMTDHLNKLGRCWNDEPGRTAADVHALCKELGI